MWISFVVYLLPLVTSVLCQLDGWEPLGCWRDLPTRAIASLEGRSKLLSDNWKERANPLNACAEAAKEEKLKVFAIQDGGQCFGGPYAHIFFSQYGPSNLCKGGVGGIWSSNVYTSDTAYTRVLNSKRENEKLVKCSKPLDMIFLIDGSGDSDVENKLRWDQMLKFVSKATEHFDTATTKIGVISYGSEPKPIVNIHDNKDELAMRDSIISARFPGGPRTINEALTKAWKDQLKHTDRQRSRVIVALTTGSMDYGPWGSSLFLTNRGVRLLSFGIDRAPSYRYLETLASGKHPENIYSIDSEQLDATLPYFAKDVCTGFKKSKIETIRKDKEIDLISSHDFETVGSIVERKSGKEANSTPMAVNLTSSKAVENNEHHEVESKVANDKHISEQQTKGTMLLDSNDKEIQRENTFFNHDSIGKAMSNGSNGKANEDNKLESAKVAHIFPVNNSSLSDGEIVEKLKEDAVEVLRNTEQSNNDKNVSIIASSGKPIVRGNPNEKNATVGEMDTTKNQTSSFANEVVSNWKIESFSPSSKNTSNMENKTSNEKEGDSQRLKQAEESHKIENQADGGSSSDFRESKPKQYKGASNETSADALTANANTSNKKLEVDKMPEAAMSNGKALEIKSKDEKKDESVDKFDNNAEISSSSNLTKATSNSNINQTSSSGSNVSSESASDSTKSDKKPSNVGQNSSQGSNVKNVGDATNKDLDKEIFNGLQEQRESIGHDDNEKDDEAMLNEVKLDSDIDNYTNESRNTSDKKFMEESVPEDENTIEEDERATQSALEQKRREIDVLLKKLDETRRRKRRSKSKQKFKDSKDDDGKENFDESENTRFLDKKGGHSKEKKESENGMETGMKRRLHKNTHTRTPTRHHILTQQNDSTKFHIQRPLTAVPTAKALKLLDKLYSSNKIIDNIYRNDRQNMKLKFDSFDPQYSSKSRKILKESRYGKFKTRTNGRKLKMYEKENNPLAKENHKEVPDKQQFFLRNGISSRAEQELGRSSNLAYENQGRWHNENANKKHIIKSIEPKNRKNTKYSNKTIVDIKHALSNYYSYFIKHMQPTWNYGHKTHNFAYIKRIGEDKHLKRGQIQHDVKRKSRIGKQSNSVPEKSFSREENANNTTTNSNTENFTPRLRAGKEKTREATSMFLIKDYKAANNAAIDFKPMSFESLEATDSGNYTVYQFSKNNILINMQSKSGELRTFYGKPSSVKVQKRKPMKTSNFRKHPGSHMRKNSMARTRHQRVGSTFRKKVHRARTNSSHISGPPKYVDNLKYFQSSLQEEPGRARSFKEENDQQKERKKISANESHSHTGSFSTNSNLTAFDVYDNKLAHIEKQRQYFHSYKPDPDRLVITENNDPSSDSSTVKLFVNAGDENSLMPMEAIGLNNRKEGKTKSLLSDISDDILEKGSWNNYVETFSNDHSNSYNIVAKSDEGKSKKNGKGLSSEEQSGGREEFSTPGIKKIVEEETNGPRAKKREKSLQKKNQSDNETAEHDKKYDNGKGFEKNDGNKAGKKYGNAHGLDQNDGNKAVKYGHEETYKSKTIRAEKVLSIPNSTKSSPSDESKSNYQGAKGERKEDAHDQMWIFKPNPTKGNKKENQPTTSEANKNGTKEDKTAKFLPDDKAKSKQLNSKIKEETVADEGLLLSRINQELGCTRPVAVLFAIDVSDAIGTGPTRQRKWNHMKRFLRSVNDKVIHGGSIGFIVYDTEPRFLSNLEPCDDKTELFVTSGECLCDRKAASFHEGKSTCSTHAPTDDESVEDWGKQGPRTAKALNLAEKIFQNETLGETKKLVVLVTHEASTDDVTGAERSLKEHSISLVDIEIGERHNIKRRSNRFDDVIPRDHQMEVSFYKLDKAIENIFTKICKEKDPAKSRRSKIFARLRKHKNWW